MKQARDDNFLLGLGERLTAPVQIPSGYGSKKAPYTFSEARDRVAQKLVVAVEDLNRLPDAACPRDEAVVAVTLHPRYISKTEFPTQLLNAAGLRSVGSRPTTIRPERWGTREERGEAVTDQLLVAGSREAFHAWAQQLPSWNADRSGASQLASVEDVSVPAPHDKLRSIPINRDSAVLEVVLSMRAAEVDIFEAFVWYARRREARVLVDRRRTVGGLTFVPVVMNPAAAESLAEFSFLRVARGMPPLRPLPTEILRGSTRTTVSLGTAAAMDPTTAIAVLDGGLPATPDLSRWVNRFDAPGVGAAHPQLQQHGLAVTSALLFGHVGNGATIVPQPFCRIDHYRVLDDKTGQDMEYKDVLDRVVKVLEASNYDFVNLSIGPDIPITDDEVSEWTTALDDLFSRKGLLATVAAGNSGTKDARARLNRIQPPSDGVNMLAVGAADRTGATWKRAPYSCVGPGRCPGFVKPDGIAFGGSASEGFGVITPGNPASIVTTSGTSLATPLVLRAASSVRAQLGSRLSPLAIRGLMIHRAEPGKHSRRDVGWGRFETDPGRLITCDDDEVVVIYQGELPAGQHLRAPIPLPSAMSGLVTISATLLISPSVDPENSGAYTRGGVSAIFRPRFDRFSTVDGKRSAQPTTRSFFSEKRMYGVGEGRLREGGLKWEACLKGAHRMRAALLRRPTLDLYFNQRESGAAPRELKPTPYALLIGVKAVRVPDLYNQVVRQYSRLMPLRPGIRVPLRNVG